MKHLYFFLGVVSLALHASAQALPVCNTKKVIDMSYCTRGNQQRARALQERDLASILAEMR